jgi:Cation efflux family
VDFLSSAVVLWRFFAPSDVTDKLEAKLKSREERASIAISVILVALGVGIWIMAIEDLLRGQEDPGEQEWALVVSFFSLFFFGILTAFKFHYAKALDSPSLNKDGICSLIGTTLSASLFADTLIIKTAPSVWWIDPVVAIICGFASLVYGLKALYVARYVESLPIFSGSWWTECGDHEQEIPTEENGNWEEPKHYWT